MHRNQDAEGNLLEDVEIVIPLQSRVDVMRERHAGITALVAVLEADRARAVEV